MIEPKFIYSCDHNLIDYGEKHKTIKILKNRKNVDGTNANDVFTVGGTLKSIDLVYSPDSKSNELRFCCKKSKAGCIYEEGVDFTVSVSSSGNTVEINWLKATPPEDKYFYIDVTYDAMMDVEITCDSTGILHSGKIDIIHNVSSYTNLILIKGKNGIYVENRDYSSYVKFDGINSANYDLYIEWNKDINETELVAIYYVAYDTYENDMSRGTIVNNEDEDVLITMDRRFAPKVCPRCNNTGWYVGIFEKSCHRAKNSNRMLQEFVKLLYTTPSDEGKYFLTLAGTTVIRSEEQVKALIANIVSKSLDRYNKMLIEARNNGGNIVASELIHEAGVSGVSIYEDNTGVEAKITLVTRSGQITNLTIDS